LKSKAKKEEEEGSEEEKEDDKPAASGKSVPELLLANKWDIETGLDWLVGIREAGWSPVRIESSYPLNFS